MISDFNKRLIEKENKINCLTNLLEEEKNSKQKIESQFSKILTENKIINENLKLENENLLIEKNKKIYEIETIKEVLQNSFNESLLNKEKEFTKLDDFIIDLCKQLKENKEQYLKVQNSSLEFQNRVEKFLKSKKQEISNLKVQFQKIQHSKDILENDRNRLQEV